MQSEKQQAVALMRYGAIAPLIAGLDADYPSKTAFYTEISRKGLTGPDGHTHHYAPSTIEKWYLNYQKYGFDAFIPKNREDAGRSRKLDEDLQERIRYLKTNYPRMSASSIYRQLKADGSIINGQISESTICRFVNQLKNELRQTPNRDMRRYERPHINEVWCGDSSVGPRFTDPDGKKHRLYIIALIDDASRFVTSIDIFYNDNFVNLMSVMKSAVSKYGRPKILNFDNGRAYKKNFLLEIERRVSIDSVVVIDQTEYEVDFRFARQRIRLRYSPDMKAIFIVEPDGTLSPIRLLNKTENASVKREKIHLCKGDE